MSDTSFVARSTGIVATWLNKVNDLVFKGRSPIHVTSTGTANAQVITLPATSLYSAYTSGDKFTYKANAANTGAMTLRVVGASSLAATDVYMGGAALSAGQIQIGDIVEVTYDGTRFQVTGGTALTRFLQSGSGANAETMQEMGRRFVFAEQFGASPGATAAVNTASIQEALTEIGSGRSGGTVLITTPGTYLLASAGVNPYQAGKAYCLDMASDNVTLHIGPGVVLKLADAQQTDASGNVNIICFEARTNITITGGGKIDGNAANQSGWTGGYLQTDGGLIVAHAGASGPNNNIQIDNLELRGSLSNSVWVRNSDTTPNTGVYLHKLRVYACGEGPVVENAEHLWMTDIYVDDTANVMVGDGLEPAKCDYVVMDRIIINGTGGGTPGTAIDIFGCRYLTLTNFVIRNWTDSGIDVNTSETSIEPTEITIGPGVIYQPGVSGIVFRGAAFNNVQVNDVVMDGNDVSTDNGFQIVPGGEEATGPITISNCSVRRFVGSGMLISTISDLTVSGGVYNDNGGAGIGLVVVDGNVIDADIARINIAGVTATGNAIGGITFSHQGFSARPSGSIANCYLPNNTGGSIIAINGGEFRDMNITGAYPTFAPPDQVFTPTLLSGGAQVSRSYDMQLGRFRLLGNNLCWIHIKIALSATGISTGDTTIGGLPFAARTITSNHTPFTIFPYEVTYSGQIGALIASAGQVITIYNMTSTGGLDALQETGLANDSAFIIEGIYEIADGVTL